MYNAYFSSTVITCRILRTICNENGSNWWATIYKRKLPYSNMVTILKHGRLDNRIVIESCDCSYCITLPKFQQVVFIQINIYPSKLDRGISYLSPIIITRDWSLTITHVCPSEVGSQFQL